MNRYCVCIVLWFCSVLIITSAASQAERNNETAPHGFGFNNPENYREYPHLHGGAGTIRYVEDFGPDDFKTKHEFLRVGVTPAKASIGEKYFTTSFGAYYLVLPPGTSIGYHRHETKEELYFVVSGRARGTVDDVTLDLKPGDCTVVNIDGKHGIYNN